jgi:hypothetical protein
LFCFEFFFFGLILGLTRFITWHKYLESLKMSVTQTDEKTATMVEHVDNKLEPTISEGGVMKPIGNEEQLDRFGARAKTDPVEIALVKKLDWYMMVSSQDFSILISTLEILPEG